MNFNFEFLILNFESNLNDIMFKNFCFKLDKGRFSKKYIK